MRVKATRRRSVSLVEDPKRLTTTTATLGYCRTRPDSYGSPAQCRGILTMGAILSSHYPRVADEGLRLSKHFFRGKKKVSGVNTMVLLDSKAVLKRV